MKKFIGTILLVASTMSALLTGIGTFILGFKILKMLWFGAINPSLCLEFLGSALLMGLCVGGATLFSPEPIEFHITDNTIVGKHDDENDEG